MLISRFSLLLIPLLCLSTYGLSTNANAQVCAKKTTPQTMSYGNFSFATEGLAKDELSKLTWDRCVYGQTWDVESANCLGSPAKLTWTEALTVAESKTNKRLPDIKELTSIMDMQCIIPPTDLNVFPNTPGSLDNGLWTSTPYNVQNKQVTYVWFIDLGFGTAHYRPETEKNFVRFIHITP